VRAHTSMHMLECVCVCVCEGEDDKQKVSTDRKCSFVSKKRYQNVREKFIIQGKKVILDKSCNAAYRIPEIS
jgi:hypothetical protein